MFKIAMCVVGLLAAASSVEAGTSVYGKPVLNRATGNAAGNLIIDNSATVTEAGLVTKIDAWAETLGNGKAYAVIFAPTGANYTVTGLYEMSFLNTTSAHTFLSPVFTGSSYVAAGSKIGLWQPTGGSGVSVDNAGLSPFPSASDSWSGLPSTAAVVGQSYTFGSPFANPRDYSFQVTVVPAPSTLWLVGSALIGWVASSRSKRSAN